MDTSGLCKEAINTCIPRCFRGLRMDVCGLLSLKYTLTPHIREGQNSNEEGPRLDGRWQIDISLAVSNAVVSEYIIYMSIYNSIFSSLHPGVRNSVWVGAGSEKRVKNDADV